jgi:hypothetical protein
LKKNVSPVAIVAVVVLLIVGLGYMGMKTAFAPAPGPSPDEIPKRPSPEELRNMREAEKQGAAPPAASAPAPGGPVDRRGGL